MTELYGTLSKSPGAGCDVHVGIRCWVFVRPSRLLLFGLLRPGQGRDVLRFGCLRLRGWSGSLLRLEVGCRGFRRSRRRYGRSLRLGSRMLLRPRFLGGGLCSGRGHSWSGGFFVST